LPDRFLGPLATVFPALLEAVHDLTAQVLLTLNDEGF
jgi:hypothetical protein